MSFFGNRKTNPEGGRAIDVAGYLQNAEINNCWFLGFKDTAIFLNAAGSVLLSNVDAHFNDYGVKVGGGGGIDIQGCNLENNYQTDLVMESVAGFTINGSYLEANAAVGTIGCKAKIYLKNCRAGKISGNYFVNYGPVGIDMVENCKNISIENNYFWWAHGISYRWDSSCFDISTSGNYNYNAKAAAADNPMGASQSDRERIALPIPRPGIYQFRDQLNIYPFTDGGALRYIEKDNTEAHYDYSPGKGIYIGHKDPSHTIASYFEMPLLSFPKDSDIVSLMDIPSTPSGAATAQYGFAIDDVWHPDPFNSPARDPEEYYANRRARIKNIQYVPADAQSVIYRIQPRNQWLDTSESVMVARSGLKNGEMTEGFDSGLARFWSIEGTPAVSEDTVKFKRPNSKFAKPSQRVAGTTGGKVFQLPISVYRLSGSSYNRIGYAIHVESGSVKVGQKNTRPVIYRAKTTNRLKDTWVYYDAIVPSSPYPIEFTCAEPDTVFYFRDVFIIPVSDNIYLQASYKQAGKVVGQDFRTFPANKTAPSVLAGNHFKTANTAATRLTDFVDGQEGQEITVIFGDDNTTVGFKNTNLKGNNGEIWEAKSEDHMRCVFDGSKWYCMVNTNS